MSRGASGAICLGAPLSLSRNGRCYANAIRSAHCCYVSYGGGWPGCDRCTHTFAAASPFSHACEPPSCGAPHRRAPDWTLRPACRI